MKNLKPIQIVFFSSCVLTVFTALGLLCFRLIDVHLDIPTVIIASLIAGGASFLVFYFAIEKFLYERIKLIYRAIRKGKITEDTDFTISMRKNIIERISNEALQFLEEHESEISKLKDQEAFRREFLGNLAHELKTPAFAIQGYLSTLLDGGLEDENINKKFLERAAKATERMNDILSDLDEITKLEVDEIQLSIEKFDLVGLAKEIIEGTELVGKEKNIQLRLGKDYAPIFVKADKRKITQVFVNLVRNAIAYGNVNGEIIIRFHSMEDLVMTEVADNGPGIESKEIPRLFERFYRIEKSRNRNEGGSGLGLAIVKHIVEAHEQSIHVRSTVDVGSTFSFTLDKA